MVASSTADHQRADGDLRRLIAGPVVSESSVVDHPGHHTRVRDWSNDRFDEAAAHQFESAQCALVPSCTGNRRGLRDLRRVGLAKDAGD